MFGDLTYPVPGRNIYLLTVICIAQTSAVGPNSFPSAAICRDAEAQLVLRSVVGGGNQQTIRNDSVDLQEHADTQRRIPLRPVVDHESSSIL